jgi:hypothetical protein
MSKETRQMNVPAMRTRFRRLRVLVASCAVLSAGVLGAAGPAQAGSDPTWDAFEFSAISSSLSTSQAGGHPDFVTSFRLGGNTANADSFGQPLTWARSKDIAVELPPGLTGNPAAFPTCPASVFASFAEAFSNPAVEFCPTDTQVGLTTPGLHNFFPPGLLKEPVYNLESPGGDVVARLGFVVYATPLFIDIKVDAERDYALSATVASISSLLSLTGTDTTIWGVPTDASHDNERLTPLEALFCFGPCGGPVDSGLPDTAFMSNPTSCGPVDAGFSLVPYPQPERFIFDWAPLPDIDGCASVPFAPTLSLAPTTRSAASASGVDFSLNIPQDGLIAPNGRASAHLKKAVITMPEGVSLNASAADGLGSCTQDQVGVERDERQLVATDGNGAPVTLTFDGETTAELPYRVGPAEAQAALEALPNISPGDIALSGGIAPWKVEFGGSLAGQDVPQITGTYSEVQEVVIKAADPNGGSFTLTFDGETTAPIPADAPAGVIQAELEQLPSIGAGDVQVITASKATITIGHRSNNIRIAFVGSLGQTDVSPITANGTALLGSSKFINTNTLVEGGSAAQSRTRKQGGTLGFDNSEANCPDSSKVGFGEIVTPVLDDPLRASLYLADQNDNPFNSLLSGYMVAKGKGVIIKVAGKFDLDPQTGRLTATFDGNPQQPFSDLELHFKGGNRGVITTPSQCGTYNVDYELTPWSGNAPTVDSTAFTIDQNCDAAGTFAPGFRAGSANPLAGAFSTFALQVTRNSGSPQFTGVSVDPPLGLTGQLAGIPYCPDSALNAVSSALGSGNAEIASPSCPAASQVGTVIAGAGSGSPFYVDTGKVYLAGPYKGAPFSMGIVTPAVAGPFDLGNVMVRTAVNVDPRTAQIHAVSDPLPTILQGIPLDLRDVRVILDRQGFAINPTSCAEKFANGKIDGTGGASANVSDRFQVGECASLGFKPRMSLRLRGGTKRGKHPALTAILRPRPGDANISEISVAFPRSEFLENAHIRTVCTRAQFAADACPKGAIYGEATVFTPLLDEPLTGHVYLRSSDNLLPDLVPDLRGPAHQPIRIESAGRTDSIRGGIRNTFDFVPDAPFTKLVLRMQGGRKGLLVNSRDICAKAYRATVNFGAHNGRTHTATPKLQARCGKKGKKGRRLARASAVG